MSSYCVYLTVYSGNKLPIFYLGSSNIKKVANGYRGSVSSKEYGKIWNQELKDNPTLFKTIIISEHLTRTEAFDHEEHLQKARKVVTNPLYINRSYANSKFSLKQHTPWTRNKFKERVPWNKGLELTGEAYKKGGRRNKGRVRGPLPETIKAKLQGPNPKKSNPGSKNGMFGKTHSDELKANQAGVASARFKGKSYEELYGKEKALELKQKRSNQLKGKDHTGKNNPRAKRILIIDPLGNEVECYGNLRDTCKELGLSFHLIYSALRSGKISEHPKIYGYSVRYKD